MLAVTKQGVADLGVLQAIHVHQQTTVLPAHRSLLDEHNELIQYTPSCLQDADVAPCRVDDVIIDAGEHEQFKPVLPRLKAIVGGYERVVLDHDVLLNWSDKQVATAVSLHEAIELHQVDVQLHVADELISSRHRLVHAKPLLNRYSVPFYFTTYG